MGYSQYVVDYRKPEVADMYKILKKPTNKFLLISDIYNLLYYRKLKKRKILFEEFRDNHLRTSRVYKCKAELEEDPPMADAYICGSDQIWNTYIEDFDNTYLLDFVKAGRKISYAASGIKKLQDDTAIDLIKSQIKDFSGVTLRESYAANKLGLSYANVVLDPVLLLKKSDWSSLCSNVSVKKRYMLCYFAGNVSFDFEKFTKRFAAEHGLQRILLMPEWRNIARSGIKYYDAGPVEFLSLIKNADIVCTNSFHGTAFSVLFNKPFIVGQHMPFLDERLTTLLTLLDLRDMEIDPQKPLLSDRLFNVDYDKIDLIVEKERNRCADILRKMIEGEVIS